MDFDKYILFIYLILSSYKTLLKVILQDDSVTFLQAHLLENSSKKIKKVLNQ